MVNVGKLSDEPWPEPPIEPITPEEVHTAAQEVAAGFAEVAATLRWDMAPADTARAMIDLGPKLVTFGKLYGRYSEQTFHYLNGGGATQS